MATAAHNPVKKGQRFLHSRMLDSTYELGRQRVPQLMEITRIAGGVVYYRPIYSGGRKGGAQYATIPDFEKYVKEYVGHDYRPPEPEYTDFSGNPSIPAHAPGISFVIGIKGKGASRKSQVQSVLFSDRWTMGKAKEWLKEHGFKYGDEEGAAGNVLRFRQEEPGQFEEFRTIQPDRRSNPSSAFGGNLHQQLVHAVTEYDRKQQGKRGYNMYALPQYLARVKDVEEDVAAGASVRKALTAGFTGRLLDVVLKATGESKSSREEQMGGYVYHPSHNPKDHDGKYRAVNPESGSESMYESFHGEPSTGFTEVREEEHYHGNLAELGELVELKVRTLSGYEVVLSFNDGKEDAEDEDNPSRLFKKLKRLMGRGTGNWLTYKTTATETAAHTVLGKLEGQGIRHAKVEKTSRGYKVLLLREGIRKLAREEHEREGQRGGRQAAGKRKIKLYRGTRIVEEDGQFEVEGERFGKLTEAKEFVDYRKAGMHVKNARKGKKGPIGQSLELIGTAGGAVVGGADKVLGKVFNPYSHLSEDENQLINHVNRWGSDGYPIHKTAKGWTWEYRGIKGPPVVFKTKAEAVKSFEAYYDILIDRAAKRINPKDPASMTAGEINKELDKLDKAGSKLTDEFIAAGRGYERPSEYLKMDDPLAMRARELHSKRQALQIEKEMRYGPGAPARLPKGFGPRKRNPAGDDVVLLCSSEDGNALFLIGGDQSLDLNAIHMEDYKKESMVIGLCSFVSYFTTKDFDKHKPIIYEHELGEDTGEMPTLRYDSINKKLYLDGGQYHIEQPLWETSPGLEN